MTGAELIEWIKKHNAENYEVRIRDNPCDTQSVYPIIEVNREYDKTGKVIEYGYIFF